MIYYVTKRYLRHSRCLDDFAVLRGILIREYGSPVPRASDDGEEPIDVWAVESPKTRIRLSVHKRSSRRIVLDFGLAG